MNPEKEEGTKFISSEKEIVVTMKDGTVLESVRLSPYMQIGRLFDMVEEIRFRVKEGYKIRKECINCIHPCKVLDAKDLYFKCYKRQSL